MIIGVLQLFSLSVHFNILSGKRNQIGLDQYVSLSQNSPSDALSDFPAKNENRVALKPQRVDGGENEENRTLLAV